MSSLVEKYYQQLPDCVQQTQDQQAVLGQLGEVPRHGSLLLMPSRVVLPLDKILSLAGVRVFVRGDVYSYVLTHETETTGFGAGMSYSFNMPWEQLLTRFAQDGVVATSTTLREFFLAIHWRKFAGLPVDFPPRIVLTSLSELVSVDTVGDEYSFSFYEGTLDRGKIIHPFRRIANPFLQQMA